MTKAIKIVLVVVLVMMTMGEAKEVLENIVKEMNERLALNEAKLIQNQEELKKTQEDLNKNQEELVELTIKNIQLEERLMMAEDDLNATKDDLNTTKDDLNDTKDDLKATKQDLNATKDVLNVTQDGMAATKDNLAAAKDDLAATKDDLAATKNPPYFHACAAHSGWLSITGQTIPYSSLLYSSTNTEGGDLDTATGIFSSPYPGSWTVTWSLIAGTTAGEPGVSIYLRKNGQNIDDSQHWSWYTGNSGGVDDQGGRTLVLHLDRGDTLDLYCENCSDAIGHTTFCVSLSTFDIE